MSDNDLDFIFECPVKYNIFKHKKYICQNIETENEMILQYDISEFHGNEVDYMWQQIRYEKKNNIRTELFETYLKSKKIEFKFD